MSDLVKLGARYPCCGRACRYELEVGVPREVRCTQCVKRFEALLVEGTEHACAMAGRPVAKVEWKELAAV